MSDNLPSLGQLQKEVGEWSQRNFGDQVSKAFRTPLYSIAPLLGIGEEIGELVSSQEEVDVVDAVGDIGVYLLDFCSRDEANLQWIAENPELFNGERPSFNWSAENLSARYGELCHVVLKRHQGIRGMNHLPTYISKRDQAISYLWRTLNSLRPVHPITAKTWLKVANRDWVEDPSKGKIDHALEAAREKKFG